MIVNQAYRFALDPNAAQIQALWSHAGASRKAFNWALGLIKAQMDQRAAEKTYGLTGDELTPAVPWNLPALRKQWNTVKGDVAPWWADNSKEAYAAGIRNLVAGLDAWRDSKSGKRKGPKVHFPRFKGKRNKSQSCTFTTGTIRVEADRKHVTLPRLGTIKLHESARKLARRLEAGTARILSATVKLDGGRWYISFSVEVDRQIGTPARPDAVLGVDVGVKHLAVLSTGEIVDNPRHLASAAKHQRRLALRTSRRVGPDRRTRRAGSKRWHKANTDLARAHARVANLRRDGLHKLTTGLAATYGTIVVEDLNVAGMVRNRNLAKAISDCGFGTIRTMLGYKTTWNGGRLVTANRWFPSSKTCSDCGVVKAKLPLRIRTFKCDACGLVLDRDQNAARNLARLVGRESGTGVAGDPEPQGSIGRGADRKTSLAGRVATKRPPGTATAGQTGTFPPQGRTTERVLTRGH
ncbi:IS607 family element RNA-guided endonuclease TnpB [Micromonospora sp. NPDC023737]|uniref:IS607 family element RNA-guided endonuclease TnpB n=1 Tax=unclassified Micromonospora TaxID=2617518 RepID=UPI0034115F73